jgi:hypothetical protein
LKAITESFVKSIISVFFGLFNVIDSLNIVLSLEKKELSIDILIIQLTRSFEILFSVSLAIILYLNITIIIHFFIINILLVCEINFYI